MKAIKIINEDDNSNMATNYIFIYLSVCVRSFTLTEAI